MSGIANWQAQIRIDIEDLKKRIKVAEGEINNFTNEDRKVKLDIDTKTLESAIQKLDKMLDSLGKGTGDFKQFENLSKELSNIVSEVQSLSKAFGKVDDSGAKTLLSSIQNIDKSLSELSQNILNVNKNISNMGGNTSGAVKQVENISNAYQDAAKEAEKLADVQSKIGQKTNISLTSDSTVEQQIKSESELNAEIEKRENIIRELQQLQEKLTVHEDFHGNDRYFADQLPTEEEIREADKRIKQLTGTNNIFNVDKLIQDRNKWLSEVKYSLEEYDDLIKANDQKALDEYTTRGLSRIGGAESFFGYEDNNFSIASKFDEEKEKIQNEINDLYTDLDKLDEKMNLDSNNSSVDNTVQSQEKLQSELKETQKQAEKTAQAVKESTTTASTGQKKDAFPSTEATASVKKVADGFKEVKQKTEKATESAKDYVRTISQVGEWNVDSKVSVVKEKNDGQLETWSYDAKRGKKDIAYDKDGNINYGDPIITTISNYKQLEQTIVKADDKLRDLKKTLKDTKEINPNASTENIEKQIEYQEEYISLLEKTVKTISKSDEYFLNGQQIIDTRKKAATEYDLKQGTKSDIANAKQSAKANEQAIRQEQKLTDELRKQEEQARKTALSYTESASKKLSDAISKYSYGDSSDATAMMKQMNRGLSNFGDLSNIKSDIKNFDSIVDAIITDLKHSHEESLFALNNEIKAEETMQKQKDAFNKSNLNAIDMEIQKREEEAKAFSNSLKAQMESQQQAESQMSKLESTLSKYQAKKDSYDATIARLKDGGWTSDEYLKNVQAVKDAVKKYEDLLSDIKAKGGIASEEDVQKLKEYEGEIKKTISTVTNMSASEKGYNFVSGQKELDKIHKLLEENSRMSSEAKNKIKAYYAEIESGNPSMSLDRIHGEIMKIYNAEVEAGRAGKSMWSIIKSSGLHQIAAQMAGMFGFYDVINLGKQAIEVVTELDSAFTEMRKVSDETTQSLKNYQKTTFDTANDVGTTAMQIQNSTADWQRLGYSLDEASELAKNSNIYKNVGDMDIDEATEHMISSVQAWKSEFNDAVTASEEIMNRYNKIGNEFAISSADIGEAMENSAAALKAGGNDLNESIGLITAGNLIQQDASTTASAMKILSLRIRGAKADLDAMGESTDDLSDSTSKMREELKALTGVDIMKDENTFKSTAEIIQEMGKNWDKLTDVSKAAALEKLAGKNRASTVSGLIENYETIGKVIEAAENSENSALEENEKYLESIEGRTQKLTNQLQELASVSIKDDWIKGIISGLTNLLDLVTKLVDKIGIVPTILSGVGIFKGIKTFSKNLA